MSLRADVPIFGHPVDGVPLVLRPSAYALIPTTAGYIAVVRTPKGSFLPGGGIDPGESTEQAVIRESREECGLAVVPRRLVGRAVEIVFAAAENACFEKDSTFVEVGIQGPAPAEECDHTLVWLTPTEAIQSLSHESHRWAVRRYTEITGRQPS